MEALPIYFFREAEDPCFDDVEVGGVNREVFLVVIEKFDADFRGKNVVLNKARGT
jgi:hypothetical protein